MKRLILLLMTLCSCAMLCACGDIYITASPYTTEELAKLIESFPTAQSVAAEESAEAQTVQAVAQTETLTAAVTTQETVQAVSAVSVASETQVVPGPFGTTSTTGTASGNVYVTKSPYSESVPVGGSCVFIASAANATSVKWYVANWDASVILNLADAPYYFSGLTVAGLGTGYVTLMNVPYSMNGWRIQACFEGNGGPVYSDYCYIYSYYYQYCSAPEPCRPCDHLFDCCWDPWQVDWRDERFDPCGPGGGCPCDDPQPDPQPVPDPVPVNPQPAQEQGGCNCGTGETQQTTSQTGCSCGTNTNTNSGDWTAGTPVI